MKRLGIIDADILAYEASIGAEEKVDWGEGQFTYHGNLPLGIAYAESHITKLKKELELDDYILAFTSDTSNFRKAVFPEYKQTRTGKQRPIILPELREHLQSNHTSFMRDGLEGDDVMGILATSSSIPAVKGFDDRIIISIDKDMAQIPGRVYNDRQKKMTEVTVEDGLYMLWYQVMTGDVIDNYPGLPGVGPKKAESVLSGVECDEYEAVVTALYQERGQTVQYLESQVNCARILQSNMYDYKKKEPKLWKSKIQWVV